MIELPKRIFLAGRFCSGKGYIAQQFVQLGYKEFAWSDAVYDEVAFLCGVSIEHIRQHKGDYRKYLQSVGAQRRKENPNYWIDRFFERVAGVDRYIEAGTRYPNEVEAAWRHNGFVIRVVTPASIRLSRYKRLYGVYPTQEQINHESEIQVDKLNVDLEISGLFPRDYPTYIKTLV